MIIEIKDLPPGRKVKQISVDVIFEDDGVKVSQSTVNSCPPEDPKFDSPPPPKRSLQEGKGEAKAIPPEMQDMEF